MDNPTEATKPIIPMIKLNGDVRKNIKSALTTPKIDAPIESPIPALFCDTYSYIHPMWHNFYVIKMNLYSIK